jgi:hypothetical protein
MITLTRFPSSPARIAQSFSDWPRAPGLGFCFRHEGVGCCCSSPC